MDSRRTYQVAIVGGGPVGLFLAICLRREGISCIVLEKRAQAITHSRSIGIHPVSLEAFAGVGLAEPFLKKGLKIDEGAAYCNSSKIGTISFRSCPPPYSFLLTLPQHKTEKILANHLQAIDPDVLQRGATVTGISQHTDHTKIHAKRDGNAHTIQAKFIAGCDGKNSFVRRKTNISFNGKTYDDTYIMGDFKDNTRLHDTAAIYICNNGLIESFPLSPTVRRWVVKTKCYLPNVDRHDMVSRIGHRINHSLENAEHSMLSSFRVEKRFAQIMARNRVVLAGDSGHVISPIGGQGMNLGWLDACDLADCFADVFGHHHTASKNTLERYSKRRLAIARRAARRAEFNMAMGRESQSLAFRKLLLKGILNTPLQKYMARLFTMRGLGSYGI